jgi:hypothetical protein
VDRRAGIKLHAVTFTSFEVTGNTARITGTCENKGDPCTFEVTLVDVGPSGTKDKIDFVVGGSVSYHAGGVITSGNIRVSGA